MKLHELIDQDWKKWERDRFLKDDTKTKTDNFDPEAFKHDGFEDREMYIEKYVPGLGDPERINAELNTFTPPRLSEINNSPYQALVIRYAILRTLLQQPGYIMEKGNLLETIQKWQRDLLDTYDEESFDDDLLHLAKAAVHYQMDIDDSELNMVKSYFEVRNQEAQWKHEQFSWLDFFKRLASINRFPKGRRSDSPEHAIDTIEKGLWSLQEQALVFEVVSDGEEIVGIPEEYVEPVQDWISYEISDENYLEMLERLDVFDQQSVLIEASETFDINRKNYGQNEKRRENIVEKGIFPSDLLAELVEKDELKEIVDHYGLDANKRRSEEMIHATINYFEESQTDGGSEPTVDAYLSVYEDIADGNIQQVPPQLQDVVGAEDASTKLDVLFEQATAEIFEEVFNLDSTTLLGQQANGIVTDGEIQQDDKWLLWDNKRRSGPFKLDGSTQHAIVDYVERKQQQHDVEWFLIIAPEFSEAAERNAVTLEKQLGVDIRLLRASDFKELAETWREDFEDDGRELPLTVFYGSKTFDLETSSEALRQQFS